MPHSEEPLESTADSEPPPGPRFSLDPRSTGNRLLLAVAVGVMAILLTPGSIALHVRAMVGWDASALTFVVLSWTLIARASPEETRQRAAAEDPGRRLVFVIAIASSVFSLFAALKVLAEVRSLKPGQAPLWSGLAIAAVVLSWFVTHTSFTLRYAHLYYRRRGTNACVRFEGTEAPCDLDFAYFAFTIGMCFQVSDVVITSGSVRRYVLLHSLVSFAYNTTILALSLNLVTTLLG